jgi:hypothetical protein
MEETIIIWTCGFIVGFLIKKQNIIINLKNNENNK